MPVSKTAASRLRKSKKKSSRKHSSRTSSAQRRAAQVHRDMLRDRSLSFARAARKRKVDPRTVLHHFQSDFEKDTSGRLKARSIGRKRQTLYIPWFCDQISLPFQVLSTSVFAFTATHAESVSRPRSFF
jgi:hypothetical protein